MADPCSGDGEVMTCIMCDVVTIRRQTILTTMHLHYTVDSLYKWEGWMVTRDDDEAFGYIANEGDSLCPLGLNGGWEFQLSSGWMEDDTLEVRCGDDGPQPTDGPGPTDGQDTTPDQPTVPGPGGMQPTIVAIKVRTGHILTFTTLTSELSMTKSSGSGFF